MIRQELAVLLISAVVLSGCATSLMSERFTVIPLREQSSSRILVDQDECNRLVNYSLCMVARGYEAETPVAFSVGRKWGDESRIVNKRYTIRADREMSEAEVSTALGECMRDTTAALAGIKQWVSFDDLAAGAGPVASAGQGLGGFLLLGLLPFAVFDEARIERAIDQTFPLCMARRELSVRLPSMESRE